MKDIDENEFMNMVAKGGVKKVSTQKITKKKPKNKLHIATKVSDSDYVALFLQKGSEGEKSSVYLNKEIINQLKKIVTSIGRDKSTLGGYVEAIVINHFEQYKSEIIRLFNENVKQPFQWFLWLILLWLFLF